MAVSVFISRKLADDSIFRQRLEAKGLTVFGQSMISFSGQAIEKFPDPDWIFFYSKNGVKYFFKGLEKARLKLSNSIKWAAIGKGTAKMLNAKNIVADFVGNGDPEATAAAFLKRAKGQKVLFPRAENSRQSVQKLLAEEMDCMDLVVYTNQPKRSVELPDCDFVVFTSPMSVSAYLQNKPILPGQTIVSIGNSTGEALKGMGISDFLMAAQTTEAALAEVILARLKLG